MRRRWKGICIVGGLEFVPLITEAVKELITKYEFRLTMLSSPIQALNKADLELTGLFFNSLTPEEQTKLEDVRTTLLTKENPTLLQSIDLLRVKMGKLFLLKKQFDPKVFTIFTFVLEPTEVKWLKKQKYFSLYLQSTNPAYLTAYDTGFTFGSQPFHSYRFENITVEYLKDLFERILKGDI